MSVEAEPTTHTTSTSTADTPARPMIPPEPTKKHTKHELDQDFSTPNITKAVKTVDMADISSITSGITITTTTSAASTSQSHPVIHMTNSDADSAGYYSAEEDGKHNNHDHAADDSPSLQNALAYSTAYAGENVLDSPVLDSPAAKKMDRGASRMKNVDHLVPPMLETKSTRTSNSNSDANTATSTTSIEAARAKHAAALSQADDQSVGMMAQGLAWARRQREHRRRLYLQNQAEQQVAKIQQAQAAEKKEQAAAIANRGLLDNSTFASLAKSMSPSPFAGMSRGSSGDGGRDMSSNGGNGDAEDEYEDAYDTADGTSSSDKYSLKTDRQFARDKGSDVVKAAMISKSGAGYTVQLAVPDEEPEEEGASWIPPVRVEPEAELERHPYVLLEHHMQQIAIHVLPRGIAYCQWKRLYSLARDGDSFEACLRLVHGARRTLLVVRTSRNAIFGGFADMPWEPQSAGGARYFGGPNACLFKVEPINNHTHTHGNNNKTNTDSASSSDNGDDTEQNDDTPADGVKCYKWSGANRYIQLCDMQHKMLAFGGGGEEGAFGLCVEKDFERGSTGPCATFNNEPLCEQEDFEIVDMEIFGFLVGQF
jgi:hypothetical protein